MKKLFLLLIMVLAFNLSNAQSLKVNDKELNEYSFIEVYSTVGDFSAKESVFIDTGDNKFKITNQSATKNQCVYMDGEKLKKGNSMVVTKYLLLNKWKIVDTREQELGNLKVTVKTYIKEEQ